MEKQSTRKFLKLLIALVALFLLAASALMLASCKEHVHQYELDESKSTNATCNQAGSQTFVCPECGDIYVNVVPATGQHTWQETKVYPASCESEGWTVFTCSVCGTQKQDNWTPKLTHKYEVAETHEATCTTDGYQIFECSFCGDRYTDSQYTAEHPKLGHDWGTNTDTEDTATPAADKLEGWYTVSAADCLNAQVLERKCARCGETEKKVGAAATGHKVEGQKDDETLEEALARLFTYDDGVKGAVCAVNEKLVDAEGNAVYAFECANENCPVNVVVDNRENTKHYIKAVDHKMEVTSEETFCAAEDDDDLVLPGDVTTDNNYLVDRGEGKKVETCELCGTVKETDLEPTGHNWNTVQFDEKSAVISCEADEKLTKDAYLEYMRAELGNQAYAKVAGALTAYYTKITVTDKQKVSRVCADCGALDIATGHDYVVSPLQEGKYGLNDYQVDENGRPVDSGLEASEMDCRYVQVCANGCGKVLGRGSHGDSTATTCREYGRCEVCGEQTSKQLAHQYISVGTIIANKAAAGDLLLDKDDAKSTVTYAQKKVTWKQAYDAYTKVSATETWMTPKEGNCDTAGTDVTVCLVCLLDAANGTEFSWNNSDKTIANANTNFTYTGAVVTTEAVHDYVRTYFDLGETTLDNPKDKTQANCEFGFQVAYICSKCGDVYMNVPVGDLDDDSKVDENGKEIVESAVNDYGKYGYTNSVGFILDTSAWTESADDQNGIRGEAFTVKKANELQISNNKGDHVVYIPTDYDEYSNYTPSNCISTAEIPVICLNCGATLDYTAEELNDALTTDEHNFTFATGDQLVGIESTAVTALAQVDKETNEHNHAGTPYACGTHCNIKVDNKFACTGFTEGERKTQQMDQAGSKVALANVNHNTVSISYSLTLAAEKYYAGYELKIATVAAGASDFKNAVLSDVSKISACGDNKYTYPAGVEGSLSDGLQYLVLVDANGTVYGLKKDSFKLYTESTADSNSVVSSTTTVKVDKDDVFFVDFPSISATNLPTAAPINATTEASLQAAFGAKPVASTTAKVETLTVNVAADIALTSTTTLENLIKKVNAVTSGNAVKIVLNLNGHKITDTAAFYVSGKTLEVNNGTLDIDGVYGNSTIAIGVGATGALTLNNVTVDASSMGNASAISVDSDVKQSGVLTVNDSTIYSNGYGIKTSFDTLDEGVSALAGCEEVTIKVTDSTIAMNRDTTYYVAGNGVNKNNTAMFIGAPADVTVTGSTFTANRQVVVVRGGDVTITDSTLTLAKYEDKVLTAEEYAEKFTNNSNVDKTAFTTAHNTSFTENTYRLFGAWGYGNDVPHAAVVVGNSDTTKYQYEATVVVNGCTINTAADEAGAVKFVVGSTYANKTLGYTGDNFETAPEKVNEMVYLRVADTDVTTNDLVLCYNYQAGTVRILGVGDYNGLF